MSESLPRRPSGKQLDLPLALPCPQGTPGKSLNHGSSRQINKIDSEDRAFHDWYRFVLSFPPHLVQSYITDFGLSGKQVLLDPFCGTGTTLIEAKRHGLRGIGIEANPVAHFASSVKTDWEVSPDILTGKAYEIADAARDLLSKQGIDDNRHIDSDLENIPLRKLRPEAATLLITNSISPLPLHKTLVLLSCLNEHRKESYYRHALLALASALVSKIGNLEFGPEVGVGKLKMDVPVLSAWLAEIRKVASDLTLVAGNCYPKSEVYLADAREITGVVGSNLIDAVITSPPYPNEKDYTRTTRLESVILGFITSKGELRDLKRKLIRSNTRGVYKGDDDHRWVASHGEIQRIAESIERRRVELGKNSGFEKLYGKVTKLYFGGMARHLAQLRSVLRPGAQLAYVVGDQASYLRIMIRTGELLIDIAHALGYEPVRTDPFRTRFATATKEQLREEVVILRWNGGKK